MIMVFLVQWKLCDCVGAASEYFATKEAAEAYVMELKAAAAVIQKSFQRSPSISSIPVKK